MAKKINTERSKLRHLIARADVIGSRDRQIPNCTDRAILSMTSREQEYTSAVLWIDDK